MSKWPMVALGELMPPTRKGIDPRQFPNEKFALYSIPAYTAHEPEMLTGSEIGSSKQFIEPGDTLLSKIVPHIRRAWVVPASTDHRQIASGEWLIFRSDRALPGYLRHTLLSDKFHARFIETVAGVGGSLLRARPAFVSKIEVPLPPLEEQRRIADILDRADALCAKRRQTIERLDELTQSIFVDMFGDPETCDNPARTIAVKDVAHRVQIGPFGSLLHGSDYVEGKIPIINPTHIVQSAIRPDSSTTVNEQKYAQLATYTLQSGDIVMGRRGEMGRCAVVEKYHEPLICGTGSLFVRPNSEIVTPYFLAALLSTPAIKRRLERASLGTTMPNLNQSIVENLRVPVPSVADQEAWGLSVNLARDVRAEATRHLAELDALFASLQSRAFNGEL